MLETKLGKKLKLRNPTVLASGVNDLSPSLLKRAEKAGAGAVTTKSCNLKGREGYENPTIAVDGDYVLNAIGLANPGAEHEADVIKQAKKLLKIPIFASIFGQDVNEYKDVCGIIASAKPNAIEMDLSCPHAGNISLFEDLGELSRCVKAVVSATNIPVFAKVSPAVPMQRLSKIARAIEEAGAYGITAINTMPAMLIDINARAPVLSNKVGGLSGICLYPIALRVVYELRKCTSLPIIGTGGVMDHEKAICMLLAGANAIGIGTATWNGFEIFRNVCTGIKTYMRKNLLKSVDEIRMEKKWFQ